MSIVVFIVGTIVASAVISHRRHLLFSPTNNCSQRGNCEGNFLCVFTVSGRDVTTFDCYSSVGGGEGGV